MSRLWKGLVWRPNPGRFILLDSGSKQHPGVTQGSAEGFCEVCNKGRGGLRVKEFVSKCVWPSVPEHWPSAVSRSCTEDPGTTELWIVTVHSHADFFQ